jgi:hypothetical protein
MAFWDVAHEFLELGLRSNQLESDNKVRSLRERDQRSSVGLPQLIPASDFDFEHESL